MGLFFQAILEKNQSEPIRVSRRLIRQRPIGRGRTTIICWRRPMRGHWYIW